MNDFQKLFLRVLLVLIVFGGVLLGIEYVRSGKLEMGVLRHVIPCSVGAYLIGLADGRKRRV